MVTHPIPLRPHRKTQEHHELMLYRHLFSLYALKDRVLVNKINNQPKREVSHAILILELDIIQPRQIFS
jgi:hypothetical protein